MAPKGKSSALTTSGIGKQNQSRSITKGEVTTKNSYHDKQSGCYGRVTTKELVSHNGDYTNRGRSGYKDEYQTSTTVRVGDKRGYTEYSKQEKLTKVDYSGGKKICGSDGGYMNTYGYSSHAGCAYDHDDDDDDDEFDDEFDGIDGNYSGNDDDDDGGAEDDDDDGVDDNDDSIDGNEDDDFGNDDDDDDDDDGYDDSYSSDDW